MKTFHRYVDVDGDGIPYRTLPGVHPKGAYFTRGSGHNRYGIYTEDGDEYVEVLDRIDRKIQQAARAVPAPIVQDDAGRQARARDDRRLPCGLRRGARPAGRRRVSRSTTCAFAGSRSATTCASFLEAHEVNFIVEQNRDAQLRSLLMLETGVAAGEAGIGPLLRRVPDERASRHHGRQGEAGEGGMTYIAKPKVHHPALQRNAVGLTRRDYEGAITTLCAGCGHDSITAAHHPGVLGAVD